MNTIEGHPVPRTLIALFNEEQSRGRWSGSLEAYCRVRYLAFRTQWAASSPYEPPSFHSWMKRIDAVDSATDRATASGESNILKNFNK